MALCIATGRPASVNCSLQIFAVHSSVEGVQILLMPNQSHLVPTHVPHTSPNTQSARTKSLIALFAMAGALLCLAPAASAQVKARSRVDVALSAIGFVTKSVTGTLPPLFNSQSQTETASTSAGWLLSVRYTRSKYVGLEGNYLFTRFNETFSENLVGGSQVNVQELTMGYIIHGPTIAGLVPFAGVGSGTMVFKPTYKGGQSLPPQARVPVYATIGVDHDFSKHFGFRAQFRDVIYKAPDFGQNYLTINKRTQTFEPTIGIYLHF